MIDNTTLTIMDVIIGKCTDTLPFLKEKSPGSFPKTVHINPIIMNTTPSTINSFPPSVKTLVPPD